MTFEEAQFITNPKLSFQLNESSFRRYEDAIAAIVKNFPKPTVFNPAPLSPNTYAARLRDAMRSLSLYNWSTHINRGALDSIRKQISVKISQEGNVVVSGTQTLKEVGQEVKAETPTNFKVYKNVSIQELKAFVYLLHNRRIEPIKVVGQPYTLETSNIMTGYDVEVIEEKDGFIIL